MAAWTTRGLCPHCEGRAVTTVATPEDPTARVLTTCPDCGWSKRRSGPLLVIPQSRTSTSLGRPADAP